jgi:hypothetical protein
MPMDVVEMQCENNSAQYVYRSGDAPKAASIAPSIALGQFHHPHIVTQAVDPSA